MKSYLQTDLDKTLALCLPPNLTPNQGGTHQHHQGLAESEKPNPAFRCYPLPCFYEQRIKLPYFEDFFSLFRKCVCVLVNFLLLGQNIMTKATYKRKWLTVLEGLIL